jgi:L-fuconate dehydratase
MIDYLAFAGTMGGRVIEYVDHLHEHFVTPCVVRGGASLPPEAPGFSIQMKAETLATYRYDSADETAITPKTPRVTLAATGERA